MEVQQTAIGFAGEVQDAHIRITCSRGTGGLAGRRELEAEKREIGMESVFCRSDSRTLRKHAKCLKAIHKATTTTTSQNQQERNWRTAHINNGHMGAVARIVKVPRRKQVTGTSPRQGGNNEENTDHHFNSGAAEEVCIVDSAGSAAHTNSSNSNRRSTAYRALL